MQKLPRVCGDKHIAAFKRAGWIVNHVEGSHFILTKLEAMFISQYLCIKARTSALAFSRS